MRFVSPVALIAATPRVWAVALFLFVFVGALGPAYAKDIAPVEPSNPAVELVGTPAAVQQLYGLWSRRREAIEDKDHERSQELFDRVVQVRSDLGVRRLDGFAFSLLREAHAALADGDGDFIVVWGESSGYTYSPQYGPDLPGAGDWLSARRFLT